MPPGFLGTRADVLMDVVLLSLLVILPVLVYSRGLARSGHWGSHKRTQLLLGGCLAVVVSLFELDIRLSGGVWKLTEQSRFAGTALLTASVVIHLIFSISTALVWIGLTALSLRRFPKSPVPGAFSRLHRIWGRIAMIDMALTGVTGVELYVVGFAF